ncbi:MAG: hypothetical protein A3E80_00915 [Chlamydiae bacterium RIFCSPHIGHO2_12_FULL_49_9]|nr:MAG: hypothetical protein A3E80_00915 [Chlamydiae bacterium RIFCSPHIGHO2_12_FULL_49_9]
MVKLERAFGRFRKFKALVLGDLMLDSYTTGRVKRISPEAPVPVVEVLRQESRPGGAGNVALNLAALGGEVVALGRIGPDQAGEEIRSRLEEKGIDASSLVVEPGYQTTIKNRLIADSQQLLRVDFESISPLAKSLEEKVCRQLENLISKVEVLAVSDYGKGFLTDRVTQRALQIAREAKVPAIVDPKGIDFAKYKGAKILKPNLSEAYAAAKKGPHIYLDEVARIVLDMSEADLLLITRSEAGISLFDKGGKRSDFPVRSKEVKDVTGAGDTVLAMICLAVASGIEIELAVQLANIGAGLSIERLGCAQITLSEVARRLLEYEADGKIFDEGRSPAFHQALKERRYNLLVLEPKQKITSALFSAIRKCSGKQDEELIVYAPESHPEDELVSLLNSLNEVDSIVLKKEGLQKLMHTASPYSVYLLKEEKIVSPSDFFSKKNSIVFF